MWNGTREYQYQDLGPTKTIVFSLCVKVLYEMQKFSWKSSKESLTLFRTTFQIYAEKVVDVLHFTPEKLYISDQVKGEMCANVCKMTIVIV